MKWLARWFPPRRPEPPAHAAPASAVADSSPPAPPERPFLSWLLGCGPLTAVPLAADEQRALEALDATLALPALPADLLPRAAALVPQLLAMLRQTALPIPALAQHISKDAVLSAEVLRLASSPYYRAQGVVVDLGQAITLIGDAGLQSVIARVVLKPIFEASPGPLSARAAARVWEHAEVQARHASSYARAAGQPAFDGYLSGLLHDAGWTVALRVVDRAGAALALPPSAAFALACAERVHRLFGRAAQRWNITPGFSAFAAEARERTLAAAVHPLAAALREAQASSLAEMAG